MGKPSKNVNSGGIIMFRQLENEANELGLKYFRFWGRQYLSFLNENLLEHNENLMIAYYNRVVLMR